MGRPSVHEIANCKARIVIVDHREGVMQALKTALRELGFEHFDVVRNFESLRMKYGKDHQPDWILSTLHESEKLNGLSFLKDLYSAWEWDNTKVSLFLTTEQMHCLPAAFELGLMSWHNTEYSIRYIEKEFRELLQAISRNKHDDTKISAEYLRKYLKKMRSWNELVNLEKSLTSIFFDDYDQKLNLAEALFASGEKRKGTMLLEEIKFLDPSFAERVAQVHAEFLGLEVANESTFAERYNIENAVVVDNDDIEAGVVIEALRKLGIKSIQRFFNGHEAWLHIKERKEQPHLIVQEWQLPGLSGAYLIQRIRAHGFKEVPIIVVSSLLVKSDAALVRDMAVYQVLKKPLREKQVMMGLAWTLKQYREPTEAKMMEKKVLSFLRNNQREDALLYIEKYKMMPDVDEHKLKYLEGSLAFFDRKYKDAVKLLSEYINNLQVNSIDAMALLSRALLKLGDFAASATLMEKVCQVSPQNIDRLCELAEINLESQKFDAAKQNIEKAERLDAGSPSVVETALKHAMVTAQSEADLPTIPKDNLEEAIIFLNNFAVSKTRVGDIDQGISVYKKFLTLVKDNDEFKAIGNYNVGLAYIRKEDPGLGSVFIKRAIDIGHSRVYDRALGLLKKIEDSIRSGAKIKLISSAMSMEWEGSLKEKVQGMLHRDSIIGIRGVYRSFEMNPFSRTLLKIKKERAS
ncbi:MAG: response regulator [Oligoflexales bacterium]